MGWYSMEIPKHSAEEVINYIRPRWEFEASECGEFGDFVNIEVYCNWEDLEEIDNLIQDIADDEFDQWF